MTAREGLTRARAMDAGIMMALGTALAFCAFDGPFELSHAIGALAGGAAVWFVFDRAARRRQR